MISKFFSACCISWLISPVSFTSLLTLNASLVLLTAYSLYNSNYMTLNVFNIRCSYAVEIGYSAFLCLNMIMQPEPLATSSGMTGRVL